VFPRPVRRERYGSLRGVKHVPQSYEVTIVHR
jgi:hypothetical protein